MPNPRNPNPLSHLPFTPAAPVPTVRVASDATPMGYVIIDRADFDPARHTEYAAPAASPAESPSASPAEPMAEPMAVEAVGAVASSPRGKRRG